MISLWALTFLPDCIRNADLILIDQTYAVHLYVITNIMYKYENAVRSRYRIMILCFYEIFNPVMLMTFTGLTAA